MPTPRQQAATARRNARLQFSRSRIVERDFQTQLSAVGRQIGTIIKGFIDAGRVTDLPALTEAMDSYSILLGPWAAAVAAKMQARVAIKDKNAWTVMSRSIGSNLHKLIESAPIGGTLKMLQAEQVKLITSLPSEAGTRVHQLTREAIVSGRRAEDVMRDILDSGKVSVNRARLIARTEVARTASLLTETRARHIGSDGYFWRTVRDSDVRSQHRALEGKFIHWDEPPVAGVGKGGVDQRYHAGQGPNCFTGSTVVSLAHGCHHLWRYWYEGSLIRIQLDGSGTFIEVTPNHPILTWRGWVPAKDIQAGDYVIQSLREHLLGREDNEDYGEITFDQLFTSLEATKGREMRVASLFDFHGDTPHHDVDAIRSDDLLPGYRVAHSLQSRCDGTLSWPYSGMLEITLGGGLQVREALDARRIDQRASTIGGEASHAETVGLAAAPNRYLVVDQDSVDGEAPTQKRVSDRLGALPSVIPGANAGLVQLLRAVRAGVRAYSYPAPNAEVLGEAIGGYAHGRCGLGEGAPAAYKGIRVINVGGRYYSGHVFTMESASGWFTVSRQDIISKNCRCFVEPHIPWL